MLVTKPCAPTTSGDDEALSVDLKALIAVDVPRKEGSRFPATHERFDEIIENDPAGPVPSAVGERRMMARQKHVLHVNARLGSRERQVERSDLVLQLSLGHFLFVGVKEQ